MPPSHRPLTSCAYARPVGQPSRRMRLSLAVLVLAVAGCGDTTEPRVATTLEKGVGDVQTAQVNTTVPTAPSVRVLDQDGQPLAGATVIFSATQGGGSPGTPSATTNAQGTATAGSWTLGTTVGNNVLTASVQGLTPVMFQATGTPGPAAAVSVHAGGGQQAKVHQPVATPPAVRVTDAFGNATPDVSVTFEVSGGGGGVQSAAQVTDANGVATVGGWTLGDVSGENRLTATAAGGPSTVITAQGTPDNPAASSKQQGDTQSAQVGADVSSPPAVRVIDQFGNAVPGVTVTFAVTQSGGAPGASSPPAAADGLVEPATATTGSNGVAAVQRWRLGTMAGQNRLKASVQGLADLTFTATGTPGAPASMSLSAGDNQSAPAGGAVPVRPAVLVRDPHGNNVPDVVVTFVVMAGGGSVQGAAATTSAAGVATVGGWTLGVAPGPNRLEAQLAGLTAVTFNATGTPVPASVAVFAGNNQSAPVSTAVAVAPSAIVRDAFSNPVPGVTVTFVVTGGGGFVTGASAVTGANGVAQAGSWTLGPSAGLNTLEARVTGLSAAQFSATGTGGGGGGGGAFNIDLRFVSGLSASQQALVEQAAQRWEAIITADLPDVVHAVGANTCNGTTHPAISSYEDVVIFVSAVSIDGSFNTLARAGPCWLRTGSLLPYLGTLQFDDSDLSMLESGGGANLVLTATHEIGHVLGIGTTWSLEGLLTGAGTGDPFFTGAGAIAAFNSAGGSGYVGNKVPVENTGGPGTADAHWREANFDRELMTGFLDLGVANPLSAVTIRSLADLGYTVDVSQADGFAVMVSPPAAPSAGTESAKGWEELTPPPNIQGAPAR